MDPSCSHEPPPEISDVSEDLCRRAASFIGLWDKSEARTRQMVAELQDVTIQVNKLQKNSMWGGAAGVVAAGVAVGVAIAAPFTGSLTVAVAAAAISVAGGAAVLGFKVKQLRTESKSMKTVKEFLKVVAVLQSEIEEILQLCEDVQRRSVEADSKNIIGLKHDILKLLGTTAKFRTAGGIREVADLSQAAVAQISNMKTLLDKFRGESPLHSAE